jgi:hypothetical protein
MAGAAYPDGAVRLQDPLARGQPGSIEFVIGVGAAGTVPVAFVYADHFPGLAGDSVVRKEIGWVGENQIDDAFWDRGENFKAVALEDLDVMDWIVKYGCGKAWARVFRGGSC